MQPGEGVAGGLLAAGAGEEHAQAAAGRPRLSEGDVEVAFQRRRVGGARRDVRLGPLVGMQGAQQGLRDRPLVRVDPDGHRAGEGCLDLPGGGDHLGRGLRADAGHGVKRGRPGGEDRADRAEACLLKRAQHETSLRDVLDPFQGHVRELVAGGLGAQGAVGSLRFLPAQLRGG